MPISFETIRQPSVRAGTTWTPAKVRAALSTADGGYLANLARLCEEMLGDDRLAGVLETRVGGLLSLDIAFEDPSARKPRRAGELATSAQAKALDEGDWWQLLPENEAKKLYTWGLLMGGCPGRLVQPEEADDTGRIVPRLEFWHPAHLRIDLRLDKWTILTGPDGQVEVPFTPGTDGWVFFAPFGRERFWANGLWRGLSRWWLAKSYSIDDWARHNEVGAMLLATNTSGPPSINDNQKIRNEIAQDLGDRGGDAAVALPAGWEAHFVEVTADTRRIYQALIDAANTTYAVRVLGQNLTTEVTGGSYAAAKVHGKGEAQRIAGDAEYESTWAHDQVLPQWAELNWGSRDLAPWPRRDTEAPEDQSAAAQVFVQVADALGKMKAAGVAVNLEALRDGFGIPIADDQPKEAPPPRPAPPSPAAARLMSGDDARLAAGMVEGQQYADDLGDHAVTRAAAAMAPFLDALGSAIDGIETIDQARDVLVNFYRDSLAPDEFEALTAAVMTMGAIAGHAAVQQDAPELRTKTDG